MTDKNEKLFNAIGKLKDSYVEEAYTKRLKPSKAGRSIKRLVMLAAAAVLSVSLVVTVAANSDQILSAIFERRKALVDDKIGHINESTTVGNITLTMDTIVIENKIFDDGRFDGIWTISFHNDDGNFDGGLKYTGTKMEVLFDPNDRPAFVGNGGEENHDGRIWYELGSFSYDEQTDSYDPFYSPMYNINFGLDNPSDTITLTTDFAHFGCYGDCRLTFYGLTSYDGSIKYADKLSVEFTVTEETAQPLRQLSDYNPDISFEIGGAIFDVRNIAVNEDNIHFGITNPNNDRVNISGINCYAINYFTKLANSDEYIAKDKEVSELDAAASKQGDTLEENMENLTAWMMSDERTALENELYILSRPTEDQDILNECYELAVEIKPESGAEIISMTTDYDGASYDVIFAGFHAQFSSPIYVDDIVRVYARKIGDPSKEVTIWVPAEDKGLEEIAK